MSSWLQRLRARAPTRAQLEAKPWLKHLLPYLSHPKLWHWSRRSVASGVAIGVFFGLMIPVAQILCAVIIAIVIRANIPIAALATLVTNPLTFAPIYYSAYQLGSWLISQSTVMPAHASETAGLWANLGTIGLPLLLGLSILATLCAALSYLLTSLLWTWRVTARRRRTGL